VARMRPDTATELGRQVRQTVHRHAGRLRGSQDSRDRQMVALVSERHPGAVEQLGETSIAALLREPGPGLCSWDAARVLAAASGEPAPAPTESRRALLGAQCASCRIQVQVDRATATERAYVAGLVAAGFRPEAAANLRTPEAIADYTRRLRGLENATLPPRPRPAAPPFYGSHRVQPPRR
jgi:hypothetical protein